MIELSAGPLRCELHPGLGGAVAGLWLDGEPVLRSTPARQLTTVRAAGCHPLVPFSNRIVHAAVVWQGTQQPQVRHTGDAPHAIHGLAAQRPWEVLDQDGTTAMLACEHRADAAWPFAFDCSHTLRLLPDALELTLALTNQSAQPAPAGLGWHPVLVKRPGSRLLLRAAARWQLDADHLPVQPVPEAALDADTAAMDVDQCHEGWDGCAELRDARLHVRVRSELTRLLLHARPGDDGLLLGPVSHAPNAVHLYAGGDTARDLGLRVLQPGESMLAQMRIEVKAAA